MKKRQFLHQFTKSAKTVGSIVPSSRFLVKKITDQIDFDKAKNIIEIGSGTGPVTKAILEKMRPDAKLISFEINEEFCRILSKINDKRLILINDNAENMQRYLRENNFSKADYVVSCLPLASLPKQTEKNIINTAFDSLSDEGSYIQFQYSLVSLKKIKKIFPEIKISFTPLNVPPVFIYNCKLRKAEKKNKRFRTFYEKIIKKSKFDSQLMINSGKISSGGGI